MGNTFFLRIIYTNSANLYKITSAVESVKGAKVMHLNFISKGKLFIGVIGFQASQVVDYERVLTLMKHNRDISEVIQVPVGQL